MMEEMALTTSETMTMCQIIRENLMIQLEVV